MTKRKEKRYREMMQRKEDNLFPERHRTVVKMVAVKDQSRGIYVYLFIEKVKVVGKKYYDISDLEYEGELGSIQRKDLIMKKYVTKEGRIPTLIIDYGDTKRSMVCGEKGSLVPVCCKKEQLEKIEPGSEITIYGLKYIGYDGTIISLFIENIFE